MAHFLIVIVFGLFSGSFVSASDAYEPLRSGCRDFLQVSFKSVPFEGSIPEEAYKIYSPNDIAEGVVNWIKSKETLMGDSLPAVNEIDLMSDSQIIILFKQEKVGAILREGYRNQHQTKSSNVYLNSQVRAAAEDEFTGLKLESKTYPSKEAAVRPKSGIVYTANKGEFGNFHKDLAIHGGIAMVLKPHVKRRSLWFSGDSLELGSVLEVKKKFELKRLDPTGAFPLDANGMRSSEVMLNEGRGTFYRKKQPAAEAASYQEAIIYGDIDPEDIDHFIVVDGSAPSPSLMAFDKPIFRASVVERQGHGKLRYDQLVFRGNKLPEAIPRDQSSALREFGQ